MSIDARDAAGEYELGGLVVSDAEHLGALHCRVWQLIYGDFMDADALAALSPERFIAQWKQRAERVAAGETAPEEGR